MHGNKDKRLQAVSDAGPLISLATIEQFDLLFDLFGKVYIPRAVYTEVVVQGEGRPGARETTEATWIQVTDVQNNLAVSLLRSDLDLGESEAIVLTKELNADYILVDDPVARQKARRLGLQKVGTLGILIMAKDAGFIQDVEPFLDRLMRSNFRMGEKVYWDVLNKAGEMP